jgi:phage tail-like protein
LDAKPFFEHCDIPLQWRLWVVNVREREPKVRFVFSLPEMDVACVRDYPTFRADRLAIDREDGIHVLASASGELWTLSLEGEVSAQHPGTMPTMWLPINTLAANKDLVLSGGGGVARLRATPDAVPDAISTYITPAMVSPDGAQRGWMRADLDINMEQGAAVEVSVAATRDNNLVDAVATLFSKESLPPSTRLRQIDYRLPWSEERTKIYRGGESPAGRLLRYPLHEIDATHIWLRVRIHAMGGAKAPRLNSLRVLYPNISYTRYLPAVYQEDKAAAKLLRRLMVIFESLFGDLDTELAGLPRRIDPKTAPEDWVPFLLRWLGLPSPTELDPETQRRLLTSAPDLLRNRGTVTALEGLLRIFVGEEFSVTDNGAGPAPWTLPRRGRAAQGPRLGCDTLVFAQRQPGFRLGCSARLGEQALGYSVLDPVDLFAKRSSGIEIRIAADGERRERIQPLLQRYLPYFVPAHCHYHLRFVPKDRLSRTWMLGELRLQAESVSRLGGARLGEAPLPESTSEGVVLDRSRFYGSGPYLT